MSEKDLQEKYIQLQMIQSQLEEYQKEVEAIGNKITEIENLKESLETLQKSKDSKKSYSVIGSGIFTESELKTTSEVLVNVGANVLVKKNINDTVKMIDEQKTQLANISTNLIINAQNIQAKALELQQELQEAFSKANEKQ